MGAAGAYPSIMNSDQKDPNIIDLKGRPSSSSMKDNASNSKQMPVTQVNVVSPLLINAPKIESNVIKIIQREWDKEVERLDAKKNGFKSKQQAGDKSLVQSGHAEIESNKILYIFGNALEVLQRSEFYDQVEEMHLTYVRFDLVVYHQNLEKLKKFTKLKKIIFQHNYLNSFILLSKIEVRQMFNNLYIVYKFTILVDNC